MNFADLDFQNKACRSLLASVVMLAVADACSEPPRRPKNKTNDRIIPISRDAWTAMRFLFNTNEPGLNEYAAWLDIDPDQFRKRLVQAMQDSSPMVKYGFDPSQRRAFRFNHGWWIRTQDNQEFSEEIDD